MGDPMQTAQAMMAFQRQAVEWVAATKAHLASQGLGITPELEVAIAAEHAAHPEPPAYDPNDPELQRQARELAAQAMAAEYPPNGFTADDPRLAPIEGVSLALAAIAAKAVGFSTREEHIARVAAAIGFDPATYQRAGQAWRDRIATDVVLSAFYGQLYVAA